MFPQRQRIAKVPDVNINFRGKEMCVSAFKAPSGKKTQRGDGVLGGEVTYAHTYRMCSPLSEHSVVATVSQHSAGLCSARVPHTHEKYSGRARSNVDCAALSLPVFQHVVKCVCGKREEDEE